jgi:hypothetical protein
VPARSTALSAAAGEVLAGRITVDEKGEDKLAAELGNKPALMAFARECFERANAAAARSRAARSACSS